MPYEADYYNNNTYSLHECGARLAVSNCISLAEIKEKIDPRSRDLTNQHDVLFFRRQPSERSLASGKERNMPMMVLLEFNLWKKKQKKKGKNRKKKKHELREIQKKSQTRF